MQSAVESFFDALASNWDDWANDDLSFVRSLLLQVGITQGLHVLDVACGTGVIDRLLLDLTGEDVDAIDISSNMIAKAKAKYANEPRAHFSQDDFLRFKGGSYDFIVIYNAYPHFTDPEALRDALVSHLGKGGRFAIVHSLGRERLNHHHEGISRDISRDLLPVAEEARTFSPAFDIDVLSEGEDHYLIAGTRK